MSQFQVSILASDHPFYEGMCESVVVPTTEGMYGFKAKHCRMISTIVPGVMHFTLPGGEVRFALVSAGIVKSEGGKLLILVDTAERPEDIEANRAKLAAEEEMESQLQKKSFEEYNIAQANLARAMNRLKVHRNHNDTQS